MGYDSLQKFVRILEKQGELKRITEPLSPVFGNHRGH